MSGCNRILIYYLVLAIIQFDNVISSEISSDLKQLHILFRHGDRAPTETYKNDPYANMTWSGGWGQLTNRGKFEMYSLGMRFRDMYKNFIPDYYYPRDVRVLSSYADRCLMSAQAFLAGLFPPKGEQIWIENLLWQPIPVHYLPRSEDTLIAMKAKCATYDQEFEKVLHSELIQALDKKNAELYRYLTEHTGQVIDNIGAVEMLYNTLEIELLHNLTLPDWTRNVSLSHMKNLAARYLELFTENDFMKRMKGGVFMKEVISLMKHAGDGPFLYLYAGHDVTLVHILKTLGYSTLLKPGFGASLVVELRNNSEIKMIYRNSIDSEPEELSVPNCSSPCSLDSLEIAMRDFIPLDWEKECNQ